MSFYCKIKNEELILSFAKIIINMHPANIGMYL